MPEENEGSPAVVLVDITTKGTKEAYELGLGFKSVMVNTKLALADGWQAGQDVPAVLGSSLNDLLKGIVGIDQLDDEAKAHVVKVILSILVPVAEGVEVLTAKK